MFIPVFSPMQHGCWAASLLFIIVQLDVVFESIFLYSFPGRNHTPSAISSGDLREELRSRERVFAQVQKAESGFIYHLNSFAPKGSSLKVIDHAGHRGVVRVRQESDWLRKGPR